LNLKKWRKRMKINYFIGLICIIAILLIPTGCSTPEMKTDTNNSGISGIDQAAASSVTIEAESMSKSGYSNESNTGASGGVVVKLSGTSGSVTKSFTGTAASYDISVIYIDQTGGAATFSLTVGSTVIGTWTGNQASATDIFLTKTFSNITVANGAQIKLSGTKNGTELAKFDAVKFTPSGSASSSSSSSVISSSSSSIISSSSKSSAASSIISSISSSSSSAVSSVKSSSSSKSSVISSATSSSSSSLGNPITTIYVSPSGSDTNSGTIDSPFYSMSTAVNHAAAGTTIYVRGGTYNYTQTINLAQSGTSSNKHFCL
jgi:hypothetical protein